MSMSRLHARGLRIVTALGLVSPGAVGAQATIDLSTGDLRLAGQPTISMLTVAPRVRTSTGAISLWSAGHLGLGGSGSTRASLETVLASRTPLRFGITPTVMLRGQNDPLAGTTRNRRIDGAIGLSVGSAKLGASAAVGRAQSVHGTTNRDVQTTSATVHVARGGFQLRLGYTGNAFDVTNAMTGQSGFSISRTRLSDLTSEGSWKIKRFEMGGFVGRRVGGTMEHNATWGGGFAAVALTDRVSLVARQETAPSDPTRHLAAQRSTMLGFRIRPTLSRARFDDGSDAGQFRREFVLTQLDGTMRGLRVYNPDARSVEIAGSFNDWEPASMHRAGGGWWELLVPLERGMYNFNVRADGGRWTVPPGLQTAADEFNGTVGVIVIP